MRNVHVFLAAIAMAIAAAAGTLTKALHGMDQSTTHAWEYLRLEPTNREVSGKTIDAYDACRATAGRWDCELSISFESGGDSLRKALAAAGENGWELVAVINETEHLSSPRGLTYLFKRPRAR